MTRFAKKDVLLLLGEYTGESLKAFMQLRYARKKDAAQKLPVTDLLQSIDDILRIYGKANVVFTGLPGIGKSVLVNHFQTHLSQKGQDYESISHEDALKQLAVMENVQITTIEPKTAAWGNYDTVLENRLKRPPRTRIRIIEMPINRGVEILQTIENKTIIKLVGTNNRQHKAENERRVVLTSPQGQVLKRLAAMNTHITHVKDLGKPAQLVEEAIREKYSSMAQSAHITRANSDLEDFVGKLSSELQEHELVWDLASKSDRLIISQVKYHEAILPNPSGEFIVYTPDIKNIYLDARIFLRDLI